MQPTMGKETVKNTINKIRKILAEIDSNKTVRLMEVCGTHTMAIARSGLRRLLPDGLELVSGPGCPVCVTDQYDIEVFLKLVEEPKVILTTFGDMIKVPGYHGSLAQKKAEGADIRIVTSPLQTLDLATENQDREVVFVAVGFETTAPLTAITLETAINRQIRNFSLISLHKLITPAMKFLLEDQEIDIDGFLCPGHVSTIIGIRPYDFIPGQYHKACVVSGFEPGDILESILLLCNQLARTDYFVENQYRRAVRDHGNLKAMQKIKTYFQKKSARWRGLGRIEASALALKDRFNNYDALKKFNFDRFTPELKDIGCICGQILKGVKKPFDCPRFGMECIPDTPVGPCMVSSEGACAASYYYDRGNKIEN
jgi:hydrogenase expression/formation protein HypD